ncbi:MAG: sulfotransferase [Alphaproteobacteria bacterium]|nr:sulfotransferase [Alphaproteobacteria bacterium]
MQIPLAPETMTRLRQAEQLLRTGQFNAAAGIAREVLARSPGTAPALQLLGMALAQAGDLEGAEDAMHRYLERNPKAAGAHSILGNIAMLKKDPAAAETSYRQALRVMPNHAETHFNLALALKAQEKLIEAGAALNKAIALKPDYVEAITQSGTVLMALNNRAAAVEAFQRSLSLRDNQFEAHYNLGLALYRLDRLEDAKLSFARAASLNDRSAEAFLALGRTLNELGRRTLATSALARAAALAPDNAEAHGLLASVFLADGWTKAAMDEIGKAIALAPNNEHYHMVHGRILGELNRLEEAEAANRRAVDIAPESMEALGALGRSYLTVGRMEDAKAVFQKALALHIDDIHPHLDMARVEKFKPGDPRLGPLESFLAQEEWLTTRDRAALNYTLGRAYDEMGDFDRAFAHFEKANAAQREHQPDTEAADVAWFESAKRIFTPEFFIARAGSGSQSRVPIFVLGMPRSGTTLTEQIISSHPMVRGAGEVQDLEIATRIVRHRHQLKTEMPEVTAEFSADQLRELGDTYVARLQDRAPGSERITDKLLGNYNRIGLIQVALPNAVIIHCRRNPVDNCVSIYTNHFVESLEHANDLARLGRYYRRYHALMAHWRSVLPGRFLDVQYEDTVRDTEAIARQVIAWCGLEWDPRCLDFQKNARRVATLSITQVRQPVYTSSVERWRNYEKHLGPLLDALGDLAPAT